MEMLPWYGNILEILRKYSGNETSILGEVQFFQFGFPVARFIYMFDVIISYCHSLHPVSQSEYLFFPSYFGKLRKTLIGILIWSNTWISFCLSHQDTYGGRHLTSRLVEFFMSRTHHHSRSIFRNNLEVTRTLVEVWKERIHVPTK